MRGEFVVFTDGAAKGNPGPGGWGAIIVTPDEQVVELGGGAPHTTNNRMELSGAIGALGYLTQRSERIVIYTDSSYVIKGITQWVWNWQRRGWKTTEGGDVLNRDLWEQLAALVENRPRHHIEWTWVKGHNGTPGNERVDQIAVAFSAQRSEALYQGPLEAYSLAILPVPARDGFVLTSPRAKAGKTSRKTGPAHSYLSVIDGVVKRHTTWAECELHVKGRAGARFKKATSADDEQAILRQWGFDRTLLTE